MARAKNTDRADARRRHRTAMAAAAAADAGDEVSAEGDPAPAVSAAAVPRDARPSGSSRTAAAAPAQRLSIMQAFRFAAGPADVRGDIRALPSIIRATPIILLAPGLVLAGGVALFLGVGYNASGQVAVTNGLLYTAAQLLIYPVPMVPAFLGGFLAPRAGWLIGLLVGGLSGLLTVAWLLTVPGIPESDVSAVALQVVLMSPLFGMALGSFAGFYRRFLRVSAPQQQRKPASKSGKQAKSGR